jgi:phage shock protein C
MSIYDSIAPRRFCRNRDRALVAGVCAGLADYFGFNLKVTRVLAFICLLMAIPMTLLIYFGTVLLVPSAPDMSRQNDHDPLFRQALRSDPARTMSDVRRRFRALDGRLARLEKYVTSSRFNLDQEFSKL